ncbi:MAG: type II secretion system F family protein [Nitrospirae bacterium]|nr:type II secretion system F family protein [Nitrospirota bacterium]
MDTYYYEATTRDGNVITGTIEAANERLAVDRIQELGYFPLNVNRSAEQKGTAFSYFSLSKITGKVRGQDIINFTYQLGVLLDAGFPLDRALSILLELTDKKSLKGLIKEILSGVRGGKSFSEALSKFPSAFPPYYINMIKAAEAGGFLEETISRLTAYMESSQKLKEDIRSALVYPAVLGIVGSAAVVVLLTFVVPKFARIFSDIGEALPLPTMILLSVSSGLRDYWWIGLIFIAGAALFIRNYLKGAAGRQLWDEMKFKLPLFGKLYRESIVSSFSRTLGTLLGSGVSLLNALQIVEGAFSSDKMVRVTASIRENARKGRGIAEPLKGSDIFPPIAQHMIAVGEETGKLEEMLIKIADRFDSEIRTTVKRLLSLLEPALILFMGLVVGFIVIAMLMAIFSINELPF